LLIRFDVIREHIIQVEISHRCDIKFRHMSCKTLLSDQKQLAISVHLRTLWYGKNPL
jgi:hypothetical protein